MTDDSHLASRPPHPYGRRAVLEAGALGIGVLALPGAAAAASPGFGVTGAGADGTTWTSVTAAEQNAWQSVAYGDGVWVAVASSGTDRVMRSEDNGVTWEPVNVTARSYVSVAYGNGAWIAVAPGQQDAIRSTDGGETWQNARLSDQFPQWRSVAYGNGRWVAVARNVTAATSTDGGVTWALIDAPVSSSGASFAWWSVAYGDGVWIAVASSAVNDDEDRRVMRSEDGGSTQLIQTPAARSWTSVAYGPDAWVAVTSSAPFAVTDEGDGGTEWRRRVMRSEDGGSTWVMSDATEPSQWVSVAHGNGVWVSVSIDGTDRVMRSVDDGANWAPVTAAQSNEWRSVAYGNGVYIAVASSGDDRVMRGAL